MDTGRSPPYVRASAASNGSRPLLLLLLTLAAWPSSVCARVQQPFQPVQTAAPAAVRAAVPPAHAVAFAKRQECLTNFFSCADQGAVFNGVCCQNGQRCALDEANSPACCPFNAVCTGTAPATFVTPNPADATTAVSFVPNSFFSFPYIATSFANPGHCSAAVSQCSANFAACTAQLGSDSGNGGGYAVTVVVPGGGGTTVAPANGISVDAAAVTSICNSLSIEACSGLQPSMCTRSGTAADGFYFGTGGGNAGARPTPPPAAVAMACAGLAGAVAAGAAGMVML
ncbi:uncharacterized protein C8A04DRAFT_27570 [Dichotomopilus funicola]|uniref:Gpi-anchored protein n=1 Tax=Dichotomopilus funicola TaxID=1934379 RepID=A0AAN6V540_9PEZI|nr:hypothetical protein C8A04DRAFT_27570 [Dichotomopilus funicola]